MIRDFESIRKAYLSRLDITETLTGSNCVVHKYQSGSKPAALGFAGKQSKPAFHYTFSCDQHRDKYITDWMELQESYQERKLARRQEKSSGHSLQVGDILSGSWGYDQTNVDFYQVTQVVSPVTVKIREIAGKTLDWHDNSWTGHCVPVPNHFSKDSEEMSKRAGADNCIKIKSYLYVSKWDGKPEYFSNGH